LKNGQKEEIPMPWKESKALDERKRFIEELLKGEEDVAELCRQYGITRQTAYKWAKRYMEEGEQGLVERSRIPHHCPQAMAESVAEAIVELRRVHPRWGPRKLRAYLQQGLPEESWPATSSIGALLSREGLSHRRHLRRRTPLYSAPLGHAQAPNQVWCADYKGWFHCGDGSRCDPLTITDAFSRYLLRCRAVPKTDGIEAQSVFEAAFREYGLPEAIRTDNGPPFASKAPAGLSRLSMWWMRLGIRHERIEPGCPEQNGRHERMHQTLKAETASPPKDNLRRQQQAFEQFQEEYNQQRPHEALNYQTPASQYVASARLYPSRLPELPHPPEANLRRVSQQGSVKWKSHRAFVSEVLAREQVGLVEREEDFLEVYYGLVFLGWLDASTGPESVFVADAGAPRKRRRGREVKGDGK
jgi:transposase InsO family protein